MGKEAYTLRLSDEDKEQILRSLAKHPYGRVIAEGSPEWEQWIREGEKWAKKV